MAQGQKFSTYDRDLDSTNKLHCAALTKGAWWHKDCFRGLLTGVYYKKPTAAPVWRGLIWYHWKGEKYSLKTSTMMIRKHSTNNLKWSNYICKITNDCSITSKASTINSFVGIFERPKLKCYDDEEASTVKPSNSKEIWFNLYKYNNIIILN